MGWLSRSLSGLASALRVVHPGPAVAVVTLSAVLGAVMLSQADMPLGERWLLTVASVAGSQAFTGALNDLVDRERDIAGGRSDKPLVSGRATVEGAAWVLSIGLAVELAALLKLGPLPLVLGLAATASAALYDLALSRTPLSPLPYVVSFGLLPAWIATGVAVPVERIAAGVPLAAAFAASAHLANALRDYDADAAVGSRTMAQLLGRRNTRRLAAGLSLAVGLGVGAALLLGGTPSPAAIALGAAGLIAIGLGAGGERRLWAGMLFAAVAWTAAWALSTG
jgi:4-hydroxybenzoate polyprenyltransferase